MSANKRFVVIFAAAALSVSTAFALPTVKSVGAEQVCGSGAGRYPSIAVDTDNKPHVAADIAGQPVVYFHDFVGSSWRTSSFNTGLGTQYYNVKFEINNQNQGWISGAMWVPAGAGIIVRNDLNSNPNTVAFHHENVGGWLPIADASLNPRWVGQAIMNWTRGYWQKLTPNGAGGLAVVEAGDVGDIPGGEGHEMWVSKGADYPHPSGNKPAVHFCTTMVYQNQLRSENGLGLVEWVNQYAYNGVWSDHCYPNVVSDNTADLGLLTAYLVEDFRDIAPPYGIYMNIWRPTDNRGNGYMQFSSSALLCIDANGSSGAGRFEPQLWPANNGGVWVVYTKGGYVWLCYVPKTTTSANDLQYYQICPGTTPDVCVDADGNLHIAYNNGGIRYRKIGIAGDSPPVDPAALDMSIYVPAFTGRKLSRIKTDMMMFAPAFTGKRRRISSN